MKKISWFIVLLSIFTACNNENESSKNNAVLPSKPTSSWNEQDKNDYFQKCITETAKQMSREKASSYCSCLMDKLQTTYPVKDSLEAMPLSKMMLLAQDCIP